MLDREPDTTVKHSVGFWAAVIAQWVFAIGAGAIGLFLVIDITVPILKDGNTERLWGLLYLAFFVWTAWLSGRLAWNIQSGTQSPSASLSQNWGSALTITIVIAVIGGISYTAIRQIIVVQERARVSEAVSFVDDIASKQKAYTAKHNRLPDTSAEIGPMPPLKFFILDNVTFKNKPSSTWSIKFTRNDLMRSRRYGGYSIVYNSSGTPHYDCTDSSHLRACREELIPHE